MGIRIVVDEDLCCGHALCVDVAPKLFEMRDDEKAHVIGSPGDEDRNAAEDAERICPQMAITIFDD